MKIQELLKALTDSNSNFQEKLSTQKSEMSDDATTQIKKLTEEKLRIEKKFEEKRKANKEMEKASNLKVSHLEKDLAVNVEKLENIEKKNEDEIEQLKEQLALKSSLVQEANSTGMNQANGLKEELSSKQSELKVLEKSYGELHSTHEKEEALWEGKFAFLTEQRDSAIKNHQEQVKKYEQTISQLGQEKKTPNETQSVHSIMDQMDTKYKSQIKDLTEAHSQLTKELSDKNRNSELELNQMKEKYQLVNSEKNNVSSVLDKRIQEYSNKEQRLSDEVQMLKTDREKKMTDYQANMDKDKDHFKTRINDLERKCRESEQRKNTQMFDFEKEKAKWQIQKDHLENQKSDAQDNVKRLERKKEMLVRENEKMKNDSRSMKKMMYGGNSSGLGAPSYMRSYGNNSAFGNVNTSQNISSSSSGTSSKFSAFKSFIGDGNESKAASSVISDDKPLSQKENDDA